MQDFHSRTAHRCFGETREKQPAKVVYLHNADGRTEGKETHGTHSAACTRGEKRYISTSTYGPFRPRGRPSS